MNKIHKVNSEPQISNDKQHHKKETWKELIDALRDNKVYEYVAKIASFRTLWIRYNKNPRYTKFFQSISYNDNWDLTIWNKLFEMKNKTYLLSLPWVNSETYPNYSYIGWYDAEKLAEEQKSTLEHPWTTMWLINEFPWSTINTKIKSFMTLLEIPKNLTDEREFAVWLSFPDDSWYVRAIVKWETGYIIDRYPEERKRPYLAYKEIK